MTPSEVKAFLGYKERAEKGDREAQHNLGDYYYNGLGVAKDSVEAVKWYRKAADQGHEQSRRQLELIDTFERAKARAEKGDREAQHNLGDYYYNGLGVAKDSVEAVKWYRKAADQGHEQSKLKLELIDTFEGAEKGDAQAQYSLADFYERGIGVARDKKEAVKWWRKAADQGHVQAQYRMGDYYFLDVAEGEVEAVKWYRKAADQGHVEAQYNLGDYYFNGVGVAKDKNEAVKWWRKAAVQDHYLAQYSLGVCYANGEGVAKDEVEAYAYYTLSANAPLRHSSTDKSLLSRGILEKKLSSEAVLRGQQRTKEMQKEILANDAKIAAKQAEDVVMLFAVPVLQTSSAHAGMTPADLKEFEVRKAQAEQGDVLAQTELGSFYAIGKGVGKDFVEAVKWYRKAADQGYYLAQNMLGVCYTHGKGVAKDEVEAYAYYNLAGITAEAARKNLTFLDIGMSPDARIRGQQRAKELKKEIEAKIAAKKAEDEKKASK